MREFHTRHKVDHTADEMFALVAEVERYPEFVPLCQQLTVRARNKVEDREILVADMTVAYKVFRETFTSRVTLYPEEKRILVEYLDGPFRHLENRWTFIDTGNGQSEIDFYLAYEFRSRTLQLVMGSMFDAAFSRFSEAFERRADVIYGTDAQRV